MNNLKFSVTLILFLLMLSGCNGKLPGADARKFPADPKKRVENNMREGKAFRLSDITTGGNGGTFEFASSNELWRASLDILDFMPLASVNYSGGIIITDWYSNNQTPSESIKISVRFLTNEIRSDAIDIKIFTKECKDVSNCNIFESNENIVNELRKKILATATLYKEEGLDKVREKNKDWKYPNMN